VEATIDCTTIKGMGCWKDWTPRIGVVYDLFGNHKTALKAGFGKYDTQYSSGFTGIFNPLGTLTQAVTWNTNTNPALGPVLDSFARIPYLDMQSASDDYYAWGRRNYWKGVLLSEFPDTTVDIMVDRLAAAPSQHCGFGMITMGGAIRRIADEDSAFSGRGADWWLTTEALWDDPVDDEAHFAWGRESLARLQRVAVTTNYVNDLGPPDEHNLRAVYGGARYDRLVALKRAWDPDNVFRLNQNITPR